MKRKLSVWAALGCLLLLGSTSLWGQATASASLQGTVADKSQAVITKAQVTVTGKETGATRTAKTNEAGEYRFEQLPAGIYNVKVIAAGFAAAEANDVQPLVRRPTTHNFPLDP